MIKKKIMYLFILISLYIFSACEKNIENEEKNNLLSIDEILTEADNLNKIDERYSNLNLSETEIYIPNKNKITNFVLQNVSLSAEEREELLLQAAELFDGTTPDVNNLEYLSFSREIFKYDKIKNDSNRGENYFLKYKNANCDLGINIGGNYLYARKNEIWKLANWERDDYWIDFGTMTKSYNLRKSIPNVDIKLVNGEQSIFETVKYMVDMLQDKMPYFKNDILTIKPNEAQIYKLGENNGINISFYYEYDGVPIDNYFRGAYYDVKTNELVARNSLAFEASAIWKGSIDELYSTYMYSLEPSNEENERFIGLDNFAEILSNKLTGNSKFTIESIELVYGLTSIYPDEFYSDPDAKMWEYTPEKLIAEPVWIAYIPNTGIADTPYMRVVADAVTGKLYILK